MAVSGGLLSAAWFEWGTTTNFGNFTSLTNIGSGSAISPVSTGISGLVPGGNYFFRLVVSNTSGVADGFVRQFTTGRKVAAWGANGSGQLMVPNGLTNVVKVVGGAFHSLALKSDGSVVGWGDNSLSQLNVPNSVSNAIAIGAGYYHSLAVRSDGTVIAWGGNGSGQLDVPSGLNNVVEVASEGESSLALKADGTVVGWGDNSWGQLNVLNSLSNIVAIATGAGHILALKIDGTVIGRGYNVLGQATTPAGLSNVVAIVASPYGSAALKADGNLVGWGELGWLNGYGPALDVSAGFGHVLTLTPFGTVGLWGSNNGGQLNEPVGVTNVVAVAAGGLHSLAIADNVPPVANGQMLSGLGVNDVIINLSASDPNGDALNFRIVLLPTKAVLYQYNAGARGAPIITANTPLSDASGRVIFAPTGGFGSPYDGFGFVVNDGEFDSAPAMVAINILPPYAASQPATSISSNSATLNGMALPNGFATQAWFEWGTNSNYGQQTLPATNVGSATVVVPVQFTIINLIPGATYCFRLVISNASGLLYGAEEQFTTGKKIAAWGNNDHGQIPVPAGLTNVVAIIPGGAQNLAIRADGTIIGWGDNSFGQLNFPTNLTNVAMIAGGGAFNLALKTDGIVVGWGYNAFGQASVPSSLSNVVALAAGDIQSMALRKDGTVFAWGANTYHETNVPANLSNVVAIAAGWHHNLALRADGTVVAWGLRTSGQTNVPAGLSNVVAIAGGLFHSLALKADGTVVAWGTNNLGQLNVPSGLSNVVAITASHDCSVALKSDGSLVTWGDNSLGMLNIPAGLNHSVTIAGGYNSNLEIGDNTPPVAYGQTQCGFGINDIVMPFSGSDTNGDPINFRIVSLPAKGALFQYNAGGRGAPIVAPNTPVSDASNRVIYASAGGFGNPYDEFSFVANDGELDSAPAAAVINILPAYAASQPATSISSNSATLNGMVEPNGFPSQAWFEWGTNGSYGQQTLPASDVGVGTTVVSVQFTISDLIPGATYYFRLVLSNSSGLLYGAEKRFTTGKKIVAWGRNDFGQTTAPPGLSNVVALAAGAADSVALNNDGSLVVWGLNAHGVLAIPNTLSNVAAIAAGWAHMLALKGDGTVFAWGDNSYGQLTLPANLSNVVMVSAGIHHSVALRSDGTVVAWGDNPDGETNVPGDLTNVVAITAGGYFSLAIKIDGSVVGWGHNTYGEAIAPANLTNAIAVAGGDRHSLALKSDGTLASWGYNDFGQTNIPSGLSNVVMIAAGPIHNLALKADGTVVAWGYNVDNDTTVPDNLSNATTVAASTGGYHSLATGNNLPPVAIPQTARGLGTNDVVITLLGADSNGDSMSYRIQSLPAKGTLYQYNAGMRGASIDVANALVSDPGGRVLFEVDASLLSNPYDAFAFLANDGVFDSAPSTVTITLPAASAMTRPATSISNGIAALNGSGLPNGLPSIAWFEWGTNINYGNSTTPVSIGSGGGIVPIMADLSGLSGRRVYSFRFAVSNAFGIVYGSEHLFTTGMKIVAWGDNTYGQRTVSTILTNAVSVAGGFFFSLALKTDGSVVAWGDNTYGQTNVPNGLSNVVSIAAGRYHALALKADGTVTAWGYNLYGQANVPVGVSNVIEVAGGQYHSLALRTDGTVFAWGFNGNGQTNVPDGLSNVVAIAAGDNHNLALRVDGTIVAWGYNIGGDTIIPTGVTNAVAVSGGAFHSMALNAGGTVSVWGLNNQGEANVPAGLSNAVAVSAGPFHNIALRSDGTVVTWGYGGSEITVPKNLNNVAAVGAGGHHTLVIGNRSPQANSSPVSGYVNHDLSITLAGSDADGDAFAFRIMSLPNIGTLYQFDSGSRGTLIDSSNTPVSDVLGRVYYAPEPGGLGSPHASFKFVANDGLADSTNATLTINIILPPAPKFTSYRWNTNGEFALTFSGQSNATYSVWTSTNLRDWELLGTAAAGNPGFFEFIDLSNSPAPQRFYRARAP